MPDSDIRYLLDTSVLILMLNRRNPALLYRLKGKIVYISAITLGELYYGARNSTRIGRNLADAEALVSNFELLRCNRGTAAHYAVIKDKLLKAGRPISENDYWIAATAIQYRLTLATRDSDFDAVQGLLLEAW